MKRLAIILAIALLVAIPASSAADHNPKPTIPLAVAVQAMTVRDAQIAAQELLLNAYRCELGKDLELVPGGCPVPLPETHQIPVYLCAPSGVYSDENLQWVVEKLNANVSPFYTKESWARALITFTPARILSPSGTNWSQETVKGITRRFDRGNAEVSDCYGAAWAHSATQLVLIFVPSGGGTAGTTGYGGPIWVGMDAWGGWNYEGIMSVVAHELGHALWDWSHTDTGSCRFERSLMDSGSRCLDPDGLGLAWDLPLGAYHIPCYQRAEAGWRC